MPPQGYTSTCGAQEPQTPSTRLGRPEMPPVGWEVKTVMIYTLTCCTERGVFTPCTVKPLIVNTAEMWTPPNVNTISWFYFTICIFYVMKRPLRYEHLLMLTQFPGPICIFYIMKRPQRCEHPLMWTLFPDPISIFYIMKRPLRCEHPLLGMFLPWSQGVHISEVSLYICWVCPVHVWGHVGLPCRGVNFDPSCLFCWVEPLGGATRWGR